MEILLRAAVIDWLRSAPALEGLLNAVEEEAPLSASPPWLGIAASASTDWSTKDLRGFEIRVAFELTTRGDDPAGDGALITAIDRRVEAIPRAQSAFAIVTTQFLRARAERRARNMRAMLLEYRFRILEN